MISPEEYQRLQAREDVGAAGPSISPALRQRQEALIAQARSLRGCFGPPERRLAALFADLPPDDDPFWQEILEACCGGTESRPHHHKPGTAQSPIPDPQSLIPNP